MYQTYTELLRISKIIDCYAYIMGRPHFTTNPAPECIRYSLSTAFYHKKTTKEEIDNQDRIKKIIERFKNRSN